MENVQLKEIFKYTDYRAYLQDYYTFMKQKHAFFSHRYFMNKAKIRSPNFLKNVMEGNKNLSRESVYKFATALDLNKKESTYFYHMVFFDQVKTSDKKQYHYTRMQLFSKDVVRATVEESQVAYFSKWYHCIIRELVVIRNYQSKWSKLANDVRPHITPTQAKKSVMLLLKLGLIKQNTDGTYKQTSKNVSTGRNPVDVMVVRQYHKQACDIAKEAIDAFPPKERFVSSLIMSLSEESYVEIEEEIREFRNRLTILANKSTSYDRVYQFTLSLFPTSSLEKKGSN